MCCIADLETVLSKKEAELLRGKYKINEGVKSAKKTKGILVVVRK